MKSLRCSGPSFAMCKAAGPRITFGFVLRLSNPDMAGGAPTADFCVEKNKRIKKFWILLHGGHGVRRPLQWWTPLPFLVHVLDGGLVDQHVGFAIAIHLEATLVIPLDDAMQGFAVAQDKIGR